MLRISYFYITFCIKRNITSDAKNTFFSSKSQFSCHCFTITLREFFFFYNCNYQPLQGIQFLLIIAQYPSGLIKLIMIKCIENTTSYTEYNNTIHLKLEKEIFIQLYYNT